MHACVCVCVHVCDSYYRGGWIIKVSITEDPSTGPYASHYKGGFYSPKSGPAQRERNHSMNGIQKQPVFSLCLFIKFSFDIKI